MMDSLPDIDSGINDEPEYSDLSKTTKVQEENGEKVSLEVPTFGFTERSWRTDFVLIVEDTRLYVNKAILSLVSPVFDTMFQSGFKESSSDEMELPGKKLRDVADFLRYIYPGSMIQISPESAYNILPLAEEYQVLQLKQNCENAMLEQVCHETTVEELFRTLHVACLYNLVNLRQKCVPIACKKSEEDLNHAFENSPPPAEVAVEILQHINTNLIETVREQKQLIDDLSLEATESIASHNEKQKLMLDEATKSADTFKATIIEQENQLEIFKQYFSGEVKESNIFSLSGENYWKEYTAVLEFDTKLKIKSEKQVKIWDVPLTISVSEKSVKGSSDVLQLEITNTGKNVTAELKGRVIIVNRQPKGKNVSVLFDGSVKQFNLYRTIKKDLIDLSAINNIENGFMCNGRIGLIVQIYMTEPNRQ